MLRRLFVGLMIAGAVLTVAACIVSPEMAENWAFGRYGTAESLLDARALLWLIRFASPAIAATCWFALRHWRRTDAWLRTLARELVAVTRISNSDGRLPRAGRGVFRAAIAAWLLLAGVHWADGARRVVREWPVYGGRTGAQVLPNMSESNRDVIRYLQSATPDNARILVASDQSLYFLSYYLWPRQVFQRRHPDSEFIVPQPDQARQLAAYRLSDLTQEDIDSIAPDYVLEYFEGPAYVEPDRLLDDLRWIAFARELHADRAYVPPYNVRLRPITDVGSRP
jgi:hypothetical protein